MNKGVRFGLIILILTVLSTGIVFASFTYKGNTLSNDYSAGQNINGRVNISFNSEYADSLITSNFNGSITLIDLLKANTLTEGVDYTCTYPGCLDSYKDGGEVSTVSLSSSTPTFVGFKLIGEDISVSSVKFSLASNAGNSCARPLIIDVLDKNESFVQGQSSSGNSCGSESQGCFNSGASSLLADITSDLSCEKISLVPSPSYQLGANIKNGTSQTSLRMSLTDLNGNQLGDECVLPMQTSSIQKVSCIVNYSVSTAGDYFVCIRSDDNAGYQIKTEESTPVCGSSSSGYNIDFDVFAKPMEFSQVGNMDVNEDVFSNLNNGQELSNYVNNYLDSVYQRNCSNGCIIPFKLSGISQDLTFSNTEIKYNKGSSPPFYENKFYNLNKDKSKIDSIGALDLDIGPAGFKIPLGSNLNKLYLYFNGKAILPAPVGINIAQSFAFDITPKTFLLGARNDFQATTVSKINSSIWDFGDGVTRTVVGKSISHRYVDSNKTSYTIDVELTREDGVVARTSFDVTLGSLQTSAQTLIDEYNSRLSNLSLQLTSLSPDVASEVKKVINITQMQNLLSSAQGDMNSANGDSAYINVINKILTINAPASIEVSEEGNNIPLIYNLDSINTAYLEQISGQTLNDASRKSLKDSIAGWLDKNYDAKVSYQIISLVDDNDVRTALLTKVKVDLIKKSSFDSSINESYLIINYPKESINFQGSDSARVVGSGTYLSITDSKSISFIISDSVGLSSLGMYLSPRIESVSVYSAPNVALADQGGFRWSLFFIWIIVLVVVAFVAYVALQEWYKRRYEKYLFKNPTDVYNLISFISNSKKNGVDDSEISKKLKNAGWKGEQISYAFSKFNGKRTGMFEIPIFRFFEQKKIKEELMKRSNPSKIQ